MGFYPRQLLDTILLKIGGVAVTATPAELNAAAAVLLKFDAVLTVAQVEAGTTAIVPAVTGKQFVPTLVAWKAVGSAAGATLIQVVVETSGVVVLSHVVADCTDGVWVGETGGTVVATGMRFPAQSGKKLLVGKTGAALTTTTALRVLVEGFYVAA